MPSLAAVAALAVVVNFIELLCTAGLPAMYTAILTQHDLGPPAYYAYLGLYILAYMADDTLMVAIAVVALSSRKLTEHAGRGLKLVERRGHAGAGRDDDPAAGVAAVARGLRDSGRAAIIVARPDRVPLPGAWQPA